MKIFKVIFAGFAFRVKPLGILLVKSVSAYSFSDLAYPHFAVPRSSINLMGLSPSSSSQFLSSRFSILLFKERIVSTLKLSLAFLLTFQQLISFSQLCFLDLSFLTSTFSHYHSHPHQKADFKIPWLMVSTQSTSLALFLPSAGQASMDLRSHSSCYYFESFQLKHPPKSRFEPASP